MAFARAEIERQAPSPSSQEEEVHAREERVAADEELQQRLRTLEAQEKTFLEAEEIFQARAADMGWPNLLSEMML